MKICFVAGARPNFMKVAPILRAGRGRSEFEWTLVHTGQHYDALLSKVMFDDLGLPQPDLNLNVGSGTQAVQTAEIMRRFEPVIAERRPDLVAVVGDVNSTVACSLVAIKMGVPVAHVEAGLRSFDRSMPEEINRIVTDAVSTLLFVSEPSGVENLAREGAPAANVFFVGNTMIDNLLQMRELADRSTIVEELGLAPRSFAVVTLHRPSNVDDPTSLSNSIDCLRRLAGALDVVFPIHPRTAANLERFDLMGELEATPRLRIVPPLGYLDFLKLMSSARVLVTDSGGIQEESVALRVPCLTMRDSTERPATVDAGWNRLVGTDPQALMSGLELVLEVTPDDGGALPMWDGKASERIVDVLCELGSDGILKLLERRSGGPRPDPPGGGGRASVQAKGKEP